MRGATCAIFMMTFTSPAGHERVHRNKVPIISGGIGSSKPLYRAINKPLHLRSELDSMEASGQSRLDMTQAKTEQLRRVSGISLAILLTTQWWVKLESSEA